MEIPEYIEVKNKGGQTVAYLSPDPDGVKECFIDDRQNAECALTFLVPSDSEKIEYLIPENRIIAGGKEFVIGPQLDDAIEDNMDEQGRLWTTIRALESWALLDKKYTTVSNDPQTPTPADLQVVILSGGPAAGGYPQGSAGSALTYLLQDETEWTLGTVDQTGTFDLELEKESLLTCIKRVVDLWGGILIFDSINKTISLRSEATYQPYTGFQIRYAKNMKSITCATNGDLITRLYVFGENDLDIGSVNSGVKYLENFSYTSEIYYGVYQNQEISDPQQLKDKGTEILTKLCHLRRTYRTAMVDIRVLPDWSHEEFKRSDLVDVVNEKLNISDRTRIVRHKYNVFQPWKCELELGEPEERLAARLASSFSAANYVKQALRPNPSVNNLLKAFVNTFATTINSANGKLVWDDSTLQAIEVDGGGVETGNRVRITPGGVGISTDGGQTFVTAMTGQGLLANTVIVNELYALSAADGLSKLTGHGLEIWDDDMILRALLGWRMEGLTKKYGLTLWNKAGNKTVLDEDGILQTWQDNPGAENFDPDHSYKFTIYLPTDVTRVDRARLSFRMEEFRAYSTGAASGGGHTTPSGGGGTSGVYGTVMASTQIADRYSLYATSVPDYVSDSGNHNHGVPNGTGLVTEDDGVVWFATSGIHTHSLTTEHYHDVTLPDHTHSTPSHTHTVSAHTHPISYGIYESTLPQNVYLKINGTKRGGPYNTSQTGIDISSYLTIGADNIIEFTTERLGRIASFCFLQCFVLNN